MATKVRQSRRKLPPLEDRFLFTGITAPLGHQKILSSSLHEVEDRQTGYERSLKLWRKTGTGVDVDLRQLWLHEMRQVQRIMAYSGASEVIVDIIELVEDTESFGVLLERAGQPLSVKYARASRQHWLKNLSASRPRTLFWRNMRRLAVALGIVHAQGLVHGQFGADSVMTEGSDEPDFQLAGFEWSLWVSADNADRAQAKLGKEFSLTRAERYSFSEDWRALGILAAQLLDVTVKASGEVASVGRSETPILLETTERILLKRLILPTRLDNLDVDSITRAIDDVVADVGRSSSTRSGAFVLMFAQAAGLGEAVYDASGGDIPIDEYSAQLDWVRAELAGGATLLTPRRGGEADRLTMVTSTLICQLFPFLQAGAPTWDIAVCGGVKLRREAIGIGERDEHELVQPIELVGAARHAVDTRARLGPDALDWSTIASSRRQDRPLGRSNLIRRALLLVQVMEAVVKALEVYPVEILDTGRHEGQPYAIVRALPRNDRDAFAKRIEITETSVALKRLFEDDHRDADAKWRFSQSSSLGAGRYGDVTAAFTDVVDFQGLRAYRFEIDEELPPNGPLFLRTEQDAGTEQAILRRLRNLKALQTRADLSDMLDDPWRVRRSSRETLGDLTGDKHFEDLDKSKQGALAALWSVLPAFFVVGPPGVGKTRLATETVRRRFAADRSARMLVTAQGHDALDNLQEKIRAMLAANQMDDVVVVRSVANERRPASEDDVHQASIDYLNRLSESRLVSAALPQIRDRIHNLRQAARRVGREGFC